MRTLIKYESILNYNNVLKISPKNFKYLNEHSSNIIKVFHEKNVHMFCYLKI